MGTWSASGPRIAIPSGIASAMTMPTKPNTRPCRSGSTVSWRSVIDGVEKNGTDEPDEEHEPEEHPDVRRQAEPDREGAEQQRRRDDQPDAAALGEQRGDERCRPASSRR